MLGELSLELLDVESDVTVSEPTGTSTGSGACSISWSSGIESNPCGMIYDAASDDGWVSLSVAGPSSSDASTYPL